MNTYIFEFDDDKTSFQEADTLQEALYDYFAATYCEDDLAKELITLFEDASKALKVFNLLSWSDGETILGVYAANKIL